MKQKEFRALLAKTTEELMQACREDDRGLLIIADTGHEKISVTAPESRTRFAYLLAAAFIEDIRFRLALADALVITADFAKDYWDENFPSNPEQQADGDQGEEKD
jgi:TRAP-type uncharacterized transport system substrate-binding protein